MRRQSYLAAGLVLGLLVFISPCSSSPTRAEDIQPLALSSPAPDFDLPGVDDKNYRLHDFDDAQVLVVIFTCNHCPTAQAYEDRIIQLAKDYRDRRVAVVAISPNDPQAVRLDELGYTDLGDSFAEMKLRAKEKNFPFPYLYDGQQQRVSRAYGVMATPHVFIFDQNRKLRYEGRVDDDERGAPKSHDTRSAIDALLSGRPVPVEETRVFGCSTKWSDKRESARQAIERWNEEPVTLKKIDVARVTELAQNKSDKYRLVNVWASWCIPCVNELSEFVTMNRMYRNREFELITISLDSPEKMEESLKLLKKQHVSATNYIFESGDRDALADSLDKEWHGPVPYTVLIAPGGQVVYRHHGSIDPLEVKRAIVAKLGRTYK